MKTAVIGIGSNSVRMLVAEIDGHTGERIRRDRAGTRLFAGLDEKRMLAEDAMRTTVAAVREMAESARAEGAEKLKLFATSATRDAHNQEDFANLLRKEADLDLYVCSGEEEAALSFLGATGDGYCGVIDIGGGSTEVVCGKLDQLACSFSCQMGAVRLSRVLRIDSRKDLAPVIEMAKTLLEEKLTQYPDLVIPKRWYGTGGTFTTLAAMVLGVPWTDRTNVHGTVLELLRVEEEAAMLADLTVEERKQLPGIQAHRADIIVHGICILIACMHCLQIPQLRVSEYGNLDGFLQKYYGLSSLQ